MATQFSILPGEFHGQRSLEGHSQRDHRVLDTTSIDGYLDDVSILAIVNNAAVSIRVHMSFHIIVLMLFG